MNIVLLLITLVFVIYVFTRFENAVILFSTTLLFMSQIGCGIVGVKMQSVVIVAIVFAFIGKYSKLKNKVTPYPSGWIVCSIFISCCYLITNYLSPKKETPTILANILMYFIAPYIIWYAIGDKATLYRLLKYLRNFFIVVAVYAFIEQVLGFNILHRLLFESNMLAGTTYGDETSAARFGLTRCFSIFPYSSSFGYSCIVAFFLFYFCKYRYREYDNKNLLAVIILMPICVFFSGGRSIMTTFFACFAILLLDKNFYQSRIFKIVLICFIVLGAVLIPYFQEIYDSIMSDDSSRGSSMTMRMNQFDISLYYMMQNFWWGNGRMYTWSTAIPQSPALLGAESIWFELMIDYGMMGIISYIVLMAVLFVYMYKQDKLFILIPLSFFIAKTISKIIGIEFTHLLFFSMILLKMKTYSTIKTK